MATPTPTPQTTLSPSPSYTQPNPTPWTPRDWSAVQSHYPHPPPPLEPHTGAVDLAPTTTEKGGSCPLCSATQTIRKYPVHFCGWDERERRCCYKLASEGALLGKSYDHLPVCHEHCWRLEKERLEEGMKEGEWPRLKFGLPGCHRECYMGALAAVQRPEREGGRRRMVVPRNRSWGERCGKVWWEHWIGGK